MLCPRCNRQVDKKKGRCPEGHLVFEVPGQPHGAHESPMVGPGAIPPEPAPPPVPQPESVAAPPVALPTERVALPPVAMPPVAMPPVALPPEIPPMPKPRRRGRVVGAVVAALVVAIVAIGLVSYQPEPERADAALLRRTYKVADTGRAQMTITVKGSFGDIAAPLPFSMTFTADATERILKVESDGDAIIETRGTVRGRAEVLGHQVVVAAPIDIVCTKTPAGVITHVQGGGALEDADLTPVGLVGPDMSINPLYASKKIAPGQAWTIKGKIPTLPGEPSVPFSMRNTLVRFEGAAAKRVAVVRTFIQLDVGGLADLFGEGARFEGKMKMDLTSRLLMSNGEALSVSGPISFHTVGKVRGGSDVAVNFNGTVSFTQR